MFNRLFSKRAATEAEEGAEQPEEGTPAPRRERGLGLGLFWLIAFLLSAAVVGVVAFLAWGQLQAQVAVANDAVVKAEGDRLSAEMNAHILALTELVERAAAQPTLSSAMTSGDPAATAAQAEALTATIPGALRVRLLPPGTAYPDESLSPRLGYAGIELAHQAESGKRPALELHWPGAPDENLALARPIAAPQQPVTGVLLVAIDAGTLGRWLTAVLPEGAYAEVRQRTDGQTVIGARGDKSRSSGVPSGSAPLAGTNWELVWWLPPVPALPIQTQLLFVAPFGGAVLVLAVILLVLARLSGRMVQQDVEHLVAHVFHLLQRKREHGHTVRLREFRKAVEVLDENIHLIARPDAAARSAVPENPLFIPEETIRVEEIDGPGDPK